MALWRKHPEWPQLTVLQSPREADPSQPLAANINHRIDFIDDVELKRLQNSSWFHLCPSETEGFGHYLVEAMSVGAVTLTTNAPPMREMVTPDRGVLLDYRETGTQHLSDTFFFDESAMQSAVESVLTMSDEQLQNMGASAREWFVRNDAEFSERLRSAIRPLLTQE